MTVEYDIMLIVSYSITIHWLTFYIELAVSCYHTTYTQNIVVGIIIYYVVSNSSSIYG